jgi:hypothetical protein
MTLPEFASIKKEQQIETIKRNGCFLYVRNEGNVDVVLYQLDSFYVEVFFETAPEDKVAIRSFDDTASLDVYLKKINISALQALL